MFHAAEKEYQTTKDAQNLNLPLQALQVNGISELFAFPFLAFQASNAQEFEPRASLKKNAILAYALAEMLWYILFGAESLPHGIFNADLIKENLIDLPLKIKLKEVGREYDKDSLTFKELSEIKDEKGKHFKSLYLTAYNPALMRTEVFSHEHTPNALVSDAVRASMSIPVVFRAVNIREYPTGKPRQVYQDVNKSEAIYYMDGGILDNYPIWIFDDLKYLLRSKFPKFKPERKIVIKNNKTLGFKLDNAY